MGLGSSTTREARDRGLLAPGHAVAQVRDGGPSLSNLQSRCAIAGGADVDLARADPVGVASVIALEFLSNAADLCDSLRHKERPTILPRAVAPRRTRKRRGLELRPLESSRPPRPCLCTALTRSGRAALLLVVPSARRACVRGRSRIRNGAAPCIRVLRRSCRGQSARWCWRRWRCHEGSCGRLLIFGAKS